MKPAPIRSMSCTCCGGIYKGRQWWNQDNGHGLGDCCIEFVSKRESPERMRELYGEPGVHWGLKEGSRRR